MAEDAVADLLRTYNNLVKETKPKPKKRHICDVCNKEFTNKCGLTNHLLIHAGVKPFTCEICYKTFTKKCTLTVHQVTHSKDRPFNCEVCDKSFSRKNDLKKHEFVHLDKKNYVCDICKADFKHKNNLRRHKMKHFTKAQKKVSKVVKKQDALISLLIESYKQKQNLVESDQISEDSVSVNDLLEKMALPIDEKEHIITSDQISEDSVAVKDLLEQMALPIDENEHIITSDKISEDSVAVKDLLVQMALPIDENEHIITSESEIITEIIDENEMLVTSNTADINDVKNINHLKDVFNSVTESCISKAIFTESHIGNNDLDNTVNHKMNSKHDKNLSDGNCFANFTTELDSTLKFPLHINISEDVLETDLSLKLRETEDINSLLKNVKDDVSLKSNHKMDHIMNNDSNLINAFKKTNKVLKTESKVSDEKNHDYKTLPSFHESENDTSVSSTEKCYSCDICGQLFNDEDSLLMHISNHNDNMQKCYVCDANFDASEHLQAHLLTHGDIPLEDVDKIIDEDIESNFNKLEEISLDDIEIIGLDDDFDEKVARMYALANFEVSLDENSANIGIFEDDFLKECTLPQDDSSVTTNLMTGNPEKTVENISLEASVKNVHKIPSVIINKNINLQKLEARSSCKEDRSLIGKVQDSIPKFDILKKKQIPIEDIDDVSLNHSIQEIITKLHSDFSKESVTEVYKNIVNTEIPNMDIFSKICDFSATDSLEGNINNVNFTDDIVDKIRSLFQNNHPDNNEYLEADKTIAKNSPDISGNKNIDEHSKQVSVCHICDKTFTRKLYLQAHYLTHLDIKPYRCPICHKSFAKKWSLTIHSLIHDQIKKHSCNECEKIFLRKSDLQKHILIHTEQKPYICKVCQKEFNHRNNLRRHELIHGKKKHVCRICDKGFSDQVTLLSHTKTHLKSTKLDDLSDKFSDFGNYLLSARDKLYKCEVCGLMFARHDRLVKHKLTHGDKDPFLCDVCGSTYKNKSELQTHLLNHIDSAFDDIGVNTEEIEDLDLTKLEPSVQNMKKTYTCDQCFKVYNRSSALKYHYLTHTGEKPHECPVCQKKFGHRTTLKRHILAHSGTKLFSCKLCSKSFWWYSSLRKHEVAHSTKAIKK